LQLFLHFREPSHFSQPFFKLEILKLEILNSNINQL